MITKIDLIEYLAERRGALKTAARRRGARGKASARRARAALRDAGHPRRPAARADDRRGDDAGLPDVDLRAEGAGRAQGLRVLAHAEPDALRAGGEPGGARGRRLRPGLHAGVAASTAVLRCSTPATTWSPATISTAARFRLFDKVFRRLGLELHLRRRARPGRRRARRSGRARKLCWLETPTNPLLRLADIRAVAAICAARGVLLVRRQHLHDARTSSGRSSSAPTWSCTRRRST